LLKEFTKVKIVFEKQIKLQNEIILKFVFQVRVKVSMNPDDMDTFVFCLSNKKSGAKLSKEMADLTTFCPEKRSAPEKYGIPAGFVVMSEIPEVTAAMLDSKMVAILNKYPELVDSIHFSDQVTLLRSNF
jgi:hypothetical protein